MSFGSFTGRGAHQVTKLDDYNTAKSTYNHAQPRQAAECHNWGLKQTTRSSKSAATALPCSVLPQALQPQVISRTQTSHDNLDSGELLLGDFGPRCLGTTLKYIKLSKFMPAPFQKGLSGMQVNPQPSKPVLKPIPKPHPKPVPKPLGPESLAGALPRPDARGAKFILRATASEFTPLTRPKQKPKILEAQHFWGGCLDWGPFLGYL